MIRRILVEIVAIFTFSSIDLPGSPSTGVLHRANLSSWSVNYLVSLTFQRYKNRSGVLVDKGSPNKSTVLSSIIAKFPPKMFTKLVFIDDLISDLLAKN